MAVIEAKNRRRGAGPIIAAILAFFGLAAPLRADRSADGRAQISSIATALTAGNFDDAMTPFDKAFPDYEKLRRYFEGLAAFVVQNEIDFIDEQDDSDTQTTLTVHWMLTLTDQATDVTERREGDVNVRLKLEGKKWKIVAFSPISLFDPLQKAPAK